MENAGDKAMYEAFSQQYYATLDGSPISERGHKMRVYYNAEAKMTFEGDHLAGADAITGKLQGLSFGRVQHIITTVDGQRLPAGLPGHLILINGMLKADDDPPHNFMQSFIIFQTSMGSWEITNDIFRLGVHNFPA